MSRITLNSLGRIRSGVSALVAAAFLWTNTGGLYAGENRFWQERRVASRKFHSGGGDPGLLLASSGPTGLSPEARNFLSTLPQVGSVPLSDQRYADRSVSGLTSKGNPSRPGNSSPVWMKELLAYGDVGETYTSPKPGAPTVIHIQDAHGIEEAQKNISGIMGVLHETREANLVGMEGASGSFTLDPYRKYPPQIVKDVADYILGKGLIGGPEYAGLTLPKAPTLYGVEEGKLYLDNVAALKAAYNERPRVTEVLSQFQSATEGLKNRRYSEGLKEYDRHGKAYSGGREDLGTYVRYLAKTAGHIRGREKALAIPNIQLLLTALDWEKALDFKKVEAERLRLVEALVKVVSKPELDELVARSVEYRAGRMGYGEYHRDLWDMCERNGIRLKEFGQVMSYINYVLSSEKINRNGLITELAILEERAQNDLVETADQGTLVGISRRLALMDKLFHHEMSMADWARYKAERSGVLRVKEELAELDPSLTRLVALTETDVKPFEDFCSLAVGRNNALVTNLLAKMKSDGIQTGVLVAGGFHTEGITTLLRASETSYAVVMPKISKIPEHSDYLDVLAKDPVPLDKLLAGEKIYLVHAARMADGPLQTESLRAFYGRLMARLTRLFSLGKYSQKNLAFEVSGVAGQLNNRQNPFSQAMTTVSLKIGKKLRSLDHKLVEFFSRSAKKSPDKNGGTNSTHVPLISRIKNVSLSFRDVLPFLVSSSLAVGALSYSLVSVFLGSVPWVVITFEQFGYVSSSWNEVLGGAFALAALFAVAAIFAARKILNAIFSKAESNGIKKYSFALLGILTMVLLLPIGKIGSHLAPYPETEGIKIVGSPLIQEEVIPFLKEFQPRHTEGLKIFLFAPNGKKKSFDAVKLPNNEILSVESATAGRYFGPILATIAFDSDIYTDSSDHYGLPTLVAHEIGHHVMMPVAGWKELYDSSNANDFVSGYASKNIMEDQAEVFAHYRMGTAGLVSDHYYGGSETIKAKILLVAQQFIDQDPATGLYYLTFYSSDAKPHRYTLTDFQTKEAILSTFDSVFEKMISSKEFRGSLSFPPSSALQSVFGPLKWVKSTFSRMVVSLVEGIGEEAVFRGGMLLALSTVGLFHAFWILPTQALIFGLAHFWAERKLVRSQGGELTFSQYLFSPSFGNHFLYGLRAGAVSFGLFFFTGMMFGDAWADNWVFFLVSLAPGSLHHFLNNLLVRMGFDNKGKRRLQSIFNGEFLRRSRSLSDRLGHLVRSLVTQGSVVLGSLWGPARTTVDSIAEQREILNVRGPSPRGPPATTELNPFFGPSIADIQTLLHPRNALDHFLVSPSRTPVIERRSLDSIIAPPFLLSPIQDLKNLLDELILKSRPGQLEETVPAITDVFPANMTFGLEFEFHLDRQGSDIDETITTVNRALVKAGFSRIDRLGEHLVEIRSPSGDQVLRNIPGDWQRLKNLLRELQSISIPAGFYSVHMHVGQEGISSADLLAKKKDIGRLVKAYEAFWRALSGRGFKKPSGNIRTLLPGDLVGITDSVTSHNRIYNISYHYPTIEAKTMSGLLDAKGHLDAERLEEQLWFVFALFRSATEEGRQLPLALMGRPVVAGEKPSPQQTKAFLDHIFRGDPRGRTIAEKILIGLNDEDQGFSEQELSEEQEKVKDVYQGVGLGNLYDLHDEALGHIHFDIVGSLLDRERLEWLAGDLVAAGASNEQALSFFPPEMYGPLLLALNQAREKVTVINKLADFDGKLIFLESLSGVPGRVDPQFEFRRWVRERVGDSQQEQFGRIIREFNGSMTDQNSGSSQRLAEALRGLINVERRIDSGAYSWNTKIRFNLTPSINAKLDLSTFKGGWLSHIVTDTKTLFFRWARNLIPIAIAIGVGIMVHHIGTPPSDFSVPNAGSVVRHGEPIKEVLFAYKENDKKRAIPQGESKNLFISETMATPMERGGLVRFMFDRVREKMGKPDAEFEDTAGLIREILRRSNVKSIDELKGIRPDLVDVPDQWTLVSPAQRGAAVLTPKKPSQKSREGRTRGAAGGTLTLLQRMGLADDLIGWFEGALTGLLAPLVALIPFGVAVLFGFDVSGFFASGSWISTTLVPAMGLAVGATFSYKVTETAFFQLHKRTGVVGLDGNVNSNPTDAEARAATRTAMSGFWGAVPGFAGVFMFLTASTPGMAFLAVGFYVSGVILAGALHAWKNDRIVQAQFDRHFSNASNSTAFDSALRDAASAPIFQALRETPPTRFEFLLPRRLSSHSKTVSTSWSSIVQTATLDKLATLIESMPSFSALKSGRGNELTVTYVDLAVIRAAKNVDEQKVLAASALAEIRRAENDPRRSVVVTHSALGESESLSVSLGRILELPDGTSLPRTVTLVPMTGAMRAENGKANLTQLLGAANIQLSQVGVLQLLADPKSLDTAGIREEILVYITSLNVSELFERSLRAMEKEKTFA